VRAFACVFILVFVLYVFAMGLLPEINLMMMMITLIDLFYT